MNRTLNLGLALAAFAGTLTLATLGSNSAIAGAEGLKNDCGTGQSVQAGVPVVAVALETGGTSEQLRLDEEEAFGTALSGAFAIHADVIVSTVGPTSSDDRVVLAGQAQGHGPNNTYAQVDSSCIQSNMEKRFASVSARNTIGPPDLLGALRVLADHLAPLKASHTSVIIMGPGIPLTFPLNLSDPAVLASDPATGTATIASDGLLPHAAWQIYLVGAGNSGHAFKGQELDSLEAWWWWLARQIGGSLHAFDPTALTLFPAPSIARPPTPKSVGIKVTRSATSITIPSDLAFDFGSAALTPGATPALDETLAILDTHSDSSAQIDGFTDSIGSNSFNAVLSQQRASAVASWLIARGIAPARLHTNGFGASDFVASNTTATGRAENRRVTVTVKASGS
jgi:outer membrane protein OmpA-like peptidoglycan-associated protein